MRTVMRRSDLFLPAISAFLRPTGGALKSVLTAFGLILMEKRFIDRTDSESFRELYDQLAQAEALSAWMIAEYHVYNNVEQSRYDIVSRYLTNSAFEVAHLPLMIRDRSRADERTEHPESQDLQAGDNTGPDLLAGRASPARSKAGQPDHDRPRRRRNDRPTEQQELRPRIAPVPRQRRHVRVHGPVAGLNPRRE